jgi:lactate dehydrogenase-like 2-hydroxyacid dehydrogenase
MSLKSASWVQSSASKALAVARMMLSASRSRWAIPSATALLASPALSSMRIGILGSGDVGRALGSGFAGLGEEVMIGSRDPHQPEVLEWARKIGGGAYGLA